MVVLAGCEAQSKIRFHLLVGGEGASSSVELGVLAPLLCPPQPNASAVHNRLGILVHADCAAGIPWDEWPEQQEEVERLWRESFVFVVTRNVWLRAASAYHHLTSLEHARPSGSRDTSWPSWEDFCQDPAGLSRWAFCGGRCWDWQLLLLHVAPQAPCLVDETGMSIVDYVLDVAHLERDLRIVMDEILRRAPQAIRDAVGSAGIPPIPWANAVLSKGSAEARAARLERLFGGANAERCIQGLAAAYAEDVRVLHGS